MSGVPTLFHASCVALNGRGVLVMGPSGSGKSALALQLMAFGAQLVADDQTEIMAQGDGLIASCPNALRGLIEARGQGILRADSIAQAKLVLVVDLSQRETDRMPPRRNVTLLGVPLELVLGSQSNHFPSAVLCYLKGGRQE